MGRAYSSASTLPSPGTASRSLWNSRILRFCMQGQGGQSRAAVQMAQHDSKGVYDHGASSLLPPLPCSAASAEVLFFEIHLFWDPRFRDPRFRGTFVFPIHASTRKVPCFLQASSAHLGIDRCFLGPNSIPKVTLSRPVGAQLFAQQKQFASNLLERLKRTLI